MKKIRKPRGRPIGSISENKKVIMTFRIARDVALFLESAKMNGKNKTAIVENAIRQTYIVSGGK